MIDWLRPGATDPTIDIAGRTVPIAIRRHPTAKRLIMRLAPDGSEVQITMPRWGQARDALAFARSRTAWLERQMDAAGNAEPPVHGSLLPYRGTMMRIVWDETAARLPRLDEEQLVIGGAQAGLQKRLEKWLRSEAQTRLESDLAHYCAAARVAEPDLRLSCARRRWGSCSTSGTVRINWRLIMAPDAIRRSVVAHEVAHLVHFDHGPDFYRLLGSLFEGDLDGANAWLKCDGRLLYRYFG